MGSDDLVDTMRFAARVVLRALDLVAKPCDGLPVHIVHWRAGDYLAAVIGWISDHDYLKATSNNPAFGMIEAM